jgi:hypothetical protein
MLGIDGAENGAASREKGCLAYVIHREGDTLVGLKRELLFRSS